MIEPPPVPADIMTGVTVPGIRPPLVAPGAVVTGAAPLNHVVNILFTPSPTLCTVRTSFVPTPLGGMTATTLPGHILIVLPPVTRVAQLVASSCAPSIVF